MRLLIQQHVNATPDVVFLASTDIHSWPRHIKGIERIEVVTDGPVGVGTVFKETRVLFKKSVTEEMKITGFNPPRSYVVESDSCGSHFHTTVRFHEAPGGTCMEMEMVTRPTTLMARLMAPLVFVMQGTMKKLIARDLRDLAAAVEQDD